MHGLQTFRARVMIAMLGISGLLAPLAATAQDTDIPVQNASTVMSGEAFASPAASADASAAASPVAGGELTGYFVGDPDAPVTLQIYADYQCPFCKAFFTEIEPQIIEAYVATGQVRLEIIDMVVVGVDPGDPLDDDSLESVQAAEAAMCAAEQDAWLDYHKALFAVEMEPNTGAFSNDNLKGIASDLGLDQARFDHCLDSGTYEEAVIAFVHQSEERGVTGTPTLSINDGELFGVTESGFEGISEMLDEALAS